MKLSFTNTVIAVFVLLVVIGVAVKTYQNTKPGELDEFAQCLTENGAKMYGADWCPNCQAQKQMFGSSFEYIDYVQCDITPEACTAEGVDGYPTWKKHTGEESTLAGKGVQPLILLAETFGCELPPVGK